MDGVRSPARHEPLARHHRLGRRPPYECAKPDAIFSFFRARGFTLERLKIGGGLGCSEYVFSTALTPRR